MSSQPNSGKITNGLCPFKANINSLWKEQMALLCMEIFVFLLVCAAASQKMWFLLMKQYFRGRVRCSAWESWGELVICHLCACWVFASRYVSLRRVSPKMSHSFSVTPHKEERGQLWLFWEGGGSLKGWPCPWDCPGEWEVSQWPCFMLDPGPSTADSPLGCWFSSRVWGLGCYFWCSLALGKMIILPSWATMFWQSVWCWKWARVLTIWEAAQPGVRKLREHFRSELCCRALCLQNESPQLLCSCDTPLVTSGQELLKKAFRTGRKLCTGLTVVMCFWGSFGKCCISFLWWLYRVP